MKNAYKVIIQHFNSLLQNDEITFGLIWTLFKHNTLIYIICSDTDKSRCIRYNFDKMMIMNNAEYFCIENHYLNYNERALEKVSEVLTIQQFQRTKLISTLKAFSLHYHQNADEVQLRLTDYDWKFVSLKETHHVQYQSMTFQMKNEVSVKILINNKIIINIIFFYKKNSNYFWSFIKKKTDNVINIDLLNLSDNKMQSMNFTKMSENDFLLCNSMMLEFSLSNKL